jgi:hypothetical protein
VGQTIAQRVILSDLLLQQLNLQVHLLKPRCPVITQAGTVIDILEIWLPGFILGWPEIEFLGSLLGFCTL